jgi:outer membrane lipoprotein SlyB
LQNPAQNPPPRGFHYARLQKPHLLTTQVVYLHRCKPLNHHDHQKGNTVNINTASNTASLPTNKPLWAVVGVLGTVVVAMAGTLIYTQTRTSDVSALSGRTGTVQSTPVGANADAGAASPQAATTPTPQDEVSKPAAGHVKQAHTATKLVATNTAKPAIPAAATVAQAPAPGAAPVQPPVASPSAAPVVKAVCANCATVVSATAVQQNGTGSGVGMVAGGVLGAVVGNQFGGGNGKTVATVLGAVGGGYAGNEVEKTLKKVTVYDVSVRMEDGSAKTLTLASAVGAGAKVTVEGASLRLADGSLVSPLPVKPAATTQPGNTPNVIQ